MRNLETPGFHSQPAMDQQIEIQRTGGPALAPRSLTPVRAFDCMQGIEQGSRLKAGQYRSHRIHIVGLREPTKRWTSVQAGSGHETTCGQFRQLGKSLFELGDRIIEIAPESYISRHPGFHRHS